MLPHFSFSVSFRFDKLYKGVASHLMYIRQINTCMIRKKKKMQDKTYKNNNYHLYITTM